MKKDSAKRKGLSIEKSLKNLKKQTIKETHLLLAKKYVEQRQNFNYLKEEKCKEIWKILWKVSKENWKVYTIQRSEQNYEDLTEKKERQWKDLLSEEIWMILYKISKQLTIWKRRRNRQEKCEEKECRDQLSEET